MIEDRSCRNAAGVPTDPAPLPPRPRRQAQNCRVVNADFLEWGSSAAKDERPCFFIAMEVLDNLPHDKVAWTTPSWPAGATGSASAGTSAGTSPRQGPSPGDSSHGGGRVGQELCEAVVVRDGERYREAFRPLRDPVIRELLDICPDLSEMVTPEGSRSRQRRSEPSSAAPPGWGQGVTETLAGLLGRHPPRPDLRAVFVPTGSLRLLKALRERLPRHRAILGDFDSFHARDGVPVGAGQGTGDASGGAGLDASPLLAFQAPLVSSRDPSSGAVLDHDTYMVPLGSADIFFPTCFERLSRLHASVCGGRTGDRGGVRGEGKGAGLVLKQGDFLREYGDTAATRTMSGFNPMLDDYRNASVFLGRSV